jgi:GT2 family glycosyltransferase
MSAPIQLSIVIVNWNSIDYLRGCVVSILDEAKGVPFEIVVVDNASPAGDAEIIEREVPGVKLIRSVMNLGFAGANNLGFQNSSGKYILFLNPDTKIMGRVIQRMLESIESIPDAGIAGCCLLNGDMSVQTSCVQTFPTILNQALDCEWLRHCFPNSKLWGIKPLSSGCPDPTKVEVISGACMLVRRDVFERLGRFTEDYFMYAEDLDLCYKAVNAGYSNYYIPGASVVHFGGKSSNPFSATQMKWRSISRFCEKHRGWLYALLFRAVMSVAAICRLVAITAMRIFDRFRGNEQSRSDALLKWKLILRTLIMLPAIPPPDSRLDTAKSSSAISRA